HSLLPVFQGLLNVAQKLLGYSSIDDPVIVREGEVGHGSDGDSIVAHHRAFLDSAHTQDGHLRLVDDGQAEKTSETPRIGDGESPSLYILDAQALVSSPLRKILNRLRDAQEVLFIRPLDDRHDKPCLERHGNPHINVPLVNEVRAVYRGIDNRDLFDRFHRSSNEEGRVSQLEAVLALKLITLPLPCLHHLAHFDFEYGVDVGRSPLARHHVLSDLPAHGAHENN